MIIRLASLLLGGCMLVSGCTFGHLAKNTEVSERHASVRWAFVPGSQMVYFIILPVPGRSEDSYFGEVRVGKDCLIVEEKPYGNHTGHALASKRHLLSLKDGSPLFFGKADGRLQRVDMDWDEGYKRRTGLLPDGRVLVESRKPKALWIGWDTEHLTRLAFISKQVGGVHGAYCNDGTMVLAFQGLVLCVDPARLPAPPGGKTPQLSDLHWGADTTPRSD